MTFLDPTVIARLESFPLRARAIAQGALTGMHRAKLRGTSVEFAEYKEYSPGDEIRHIDWKVYAKGDRYVVRQFEQETELTAHLILDASGSMAYRRDGEHALSKLEYGAHLVGALSYLLIRQRDRAGLMIYGDRAYDQYVPPRARASHGRDLLAVIETALERGASGDESASEALARAAELMAKRRSLLIVASDFFDPQLEQTLAALKSLRARGHDIAVFHILDPDELELPFEGLTRFVAFESPRELLASPGGIRREYTRRLSGFLSRVADECVAAGVDYRATRTDVPLEAAVGEFLAARAGQIVDEARTLEARWSL